MTGLYVFAAVIGVFSWITIQSEMIKAVEKKLQSYAELGIFEISENRTDASGLDDLGAFLARRYENIIYMGVDNRIGGVIISDEGFYRGRVSDAMNSALKSLTASLSEGRAVSDCRYVDGKRYFLFSALSPDGRYTFKGAVPYEYAMEDMRRIRWVFTVAIAAIVIVVSFMAFAILRLDKNAEMTEEAERARERAEQANQAKTSFLANMSHEIRTPINAILGMNEMIARETHENNIRIYSGNVDSAASNLLSLINDILDFSKIESGKLELIEDEYEMSSMLNDIYQMIHIRAESKGLKFEMNVDETVPEHLYGDKLRVQQCIMNLLTNGVKYTDKGGVGLYISYERLPDDRLILKAVVEDTGKGIAEDQQEKIFDKFKRLDMKTNNTIEGTGLGLSITKTLIEMMDGTITFKSVYGAGSVFTITIPQRISGDEPMGDLSERIKSANNFKSIADSPFIAPEARILVVDDTSMNLEVVKNLLKKTEIIVDTALSGRECIEMLKKAEYDIILLDARMPEMDGVETLNVIKSGKLCPASTAIIVLTANVVAGAKEQYMEYGFDEYLPKPVKPADLEAMLLRFLPIEKVELKEEETPEDGLVSIPDWLKKNRELNISRGLELCGSPEIYMDTVARFESHASETMAEIGTALRSNDLETFTTKVHSLKSTSKLIGAIRLSSLAEDLEAAGDRRDMEYISEHISPMMSLLGELRENLSPLLRSQEKEGNIEPEDLGTLYAHLKSYVDDFNSEAVGSMIRALDHYNFPGREQERFDNLKKAYEAMDWVAIMSFFDETGE